MKQVRDRILKKFASLFGSVLVVFVATIFVASIVYAATTIGSNISTGGNLDVDGTASTTNATTTGYLYVGQDITEPPGWDFGLGDLIVTDDFFVNSQATTSASLWVGSAGSADYLNLAGGDLYVQDDLEVDGSATTTSLYLSNDLTFLGNATTTGDVFVRGGTLTVGFPTTTTGLFVGERGVGVTGTSTVGVGTQHQGGCLELTKNGLFYACYISETNDGLFCATGRCN